MSAFTFTFSRHGRSTKKITEGRSKGQKLQRYQCGQFMIHFCDGTRRDIVKLKEINDLFCIATSMNINLGKSTISLFGINEVDQVYMGNFLLYQDSNMDNRLKYLGFFLKSNDCQKNNGNG
jgi:hypothetical protein